MDPLLQPAEQRTTPAQLRELFDTLGYLSDAGTFALGAEGGGIVGVMTVRTQNVRLAASRSFCASLCVALESVAPGATPLVHAAISKGKCPWQAIQEAYCLDEAVVSRAAVQLFAAETLKILGECDGMPMASHYSDEGPWTVEVTFSAVLDAALQMAGPTTDAPTEYAQETRFPPDEQIPLFLDPGETSRQRVCVLADVHANLPALQAVCQAADDLGVSSYLLLGDVVGFGPFPRECIAMVRSLPASVLVGGDYDEMVAQGVRDVDTRRLSDIALCSIEWTRRQLTPEEIRWLATLPREARFESSRLIAIHGALTDPDRCRESIFEATYHENLDALQQAGLSTCFFGHTHVQMAYQRTSAGDLARKPREVCLGVPGDLNMINPGSVGQPRDGDSTAAFAVWEQATNVVTFHRVSYDLGLTVSALRSAGLPQDLEYRLELGR